MVAQGYVLIEIKSFDGKQVWSKTEQDTFLLFRTEKDEIEDIAKTAIYPNGDSVYRNGGLATFTYCIGVKSNYKLEKHKKIAKRLA